MGKRRASARLTPLCTLRTTEEADWLILLLTRYADMHTSFLFLLSLLLFVLFFMQDPLLDFTLELIYSAK